MDKRQEKTKYLIMQSFMELLARKDYSKITVQEIIDRAYISRSTFYAHFETKDYLLKSMCNDLFDHISAEKLFAETTHDFSLAIKSNNPQIFFTHILYHLRDNKRNTVRLLANDTCDGSDVFLSYFKPDLNDLITLHVFEQLKPKNTYVPEKFLVNHISSSFISMVQWWIANKLYQSPEELSRYFERVIVPVI